MRNGNTNVVEAAEELQVSLHATRMELIECFDVFERRLWSLSQRARRLQPKQRAASGLHPEAA